MIFESHRPDIQLPDTDLTTVVLNRARELGDRTALIDGATGSSLSFNELADQIERFAAGLHRRGFRQGDVFAIFCPNVPEYAVVFLGVAAAGGINTTVNSLYTTDDLIHQLKDSGATFLLTIPAFLERALPAAQACNISNVFVLGNAKGATSYSELLDINGKRLIVTINPQQDLVALPYSSGTTGLPKSVMLSHADFIANMVLSCEMNHIDENDTLAGVLPFFHIYGMLLIGLWPHRGGWSFPRTTDCGGGYW
jgi:acyl-CoA synthetase (AMP-forming)/AMP-acid ligase II